MISNEYVRLLHDLAHASGLETTYLDMNGRLQEAAVEPVLAVLQGMDVSIRSISDIQAALSERRRSVWRRAIEPVTVVWDGRPAAVQLRLPQERATGSIKCELELESGEATNRICDIPALPTLEATEIEGQRYVVKGLPVPALLPFGYHRLEVEVGADLVETTIICSPSKAYAAAEKGDRRFWGLFLPAYALHSKRSLGAGDFTDLQELISWTSSLGGSVVATLPFLASFLDEPFDPSPYAPVSRLFWNEFYIDVTKIPELDACPAARAILESASFRKDVEELRSMSLVDYRREMALKRRVLEELGSCLFREPSRRRDDFEGYLEKHRRLEDYARFRACCETRLAPWSEWPESMREGRLRDEDYQEYAKRYHEYVQWIAQEQIQELSGIACDGGLGLYLDLPLGVHPAGYDVWRENSLFVRRMSTGAPPDVLFTGGQNWGFPPLDPEKIRNQGYRYVINYLRHHMSHAGILRVDHVMGLHRLFWIPDGMAARDGVYVRYSAEELYAVFCLESHRNRCLVVGENLGTVPPCVNEAMESHGIHAMYVTQYELTHEPDRALRDSQSNVVASINTHDMPPFAAFWHGLDIEERVQIGFLDESSALAELESRQSLKRSLVTFLQTRGWIANADGLGAGEVLKACLAFLADGQARIVLVNIEDLWQENSPQNIPGTVTQSPNWRRKARFSFEDFSVMPDVVGFLRKLDSLVRDRRVSQRDLPGQG